MNIVYTHSKDGYTLTHKWYLDDFGFKKNSFDLFDEKKRVHFPFMGDIRANNYDRSTPIGGDDTSPYSISEYEDMFNRARDAYALV